ncbi:sulfatase-like hydrolase/transferase [bacterium]|nr:sulfatase-like hydrolase/transferase [bacterium]
MSDRPNILLITTDQQRFDTIAALGNRHIYTPHLDWLVDEGITFTRAYSDAPICMPARATIMTGKHGYESGLTGNSGAVMPMRTCPTLPGILTRAGYQTRAQGKMHFHPMRANYGFEYVELPMDYYRERHGRAHEGLPKEHGVGENEITPVISTVDETHSLTYWTVRRSIDFLETRDTTRPFFLWTSFAKPHPPWDPCANYWALYQNRDVPDPVVGDWSADVEGTPQAFMAPTYSLNNAYRASIEQLKDSKRAYYACITQIDYTLGLLFARMRELNLLENTWVLFTTDHGEMLGDHHMAAKSSFLEGSAHIPLLIRPPARPWDKKPLAGKKVDSLVDLADIMPTVLNMAGVAAPDGLTGTDLLPLTSSPAKREFYGVSTDEFYCLIQGDYKYTWARSGGCELLFNLAKDPFEQHDLAHSKDAAKVRDKVRSALIKRMAAHGSPCVENGKLKPGPAITGPQDVCKWPGFHSTIFECDVLH